MIENHLLTDIVKCWLQENFKDFTISVSDPFSDYTIIYVSSPHIGHDKAIQIEALARIYVYEDSVGFYHKKEFAASDPQFFEKLENAIKTKLWQLGMIYDSI